MHFTKCCSFIMSMMSPRVVGLIVFCLILSLVSPSCNAGDDGITTSESKTEKSRKSLLVAPRSSSKRRPVSFPIYNFESLRIKTHTPRVIFPRLRQNSTSRNRKNIFSHSNNPPLGSTTIRKFDAKNNTLMHSYNNLTEAKKSLNISLSRISKTWQRYLRTINLTSDSHPRMETLFPCSIIKYLEPLFTDYNGTTPDKINQLVQKLEAFSYSNFTVEDNLCNTTLVAFFSVNEILSGRPIEENKSSHASLKTTLVNTRQNSGESNNRKPQIGVKKESDTLNYPQRYNHENESLSKNTVLQKEIKRQQIPRFKPKNDVTLSNKSLSHYPISESSKINNRSTRLLFKRIIQLTTDNPRRNLTIYELLKPRLRTTTPHFNEVTTIPFDYDDTISILKRRSESNARDPIYVVPFAENYTINTSNNSKGLYRIIDSNDNEIKKDHKLKILSRTLEKHIPSINNTFDIADYEEGSELNATTTVEVMTETTTLTTTLLDFQQVEDSTSNSSETISSENEDSAERKPKMTDNTNNTDSSFKKPRLEPKVYYKYDKKPTGGNPLTHFPEYRPGTLVHYADIFQRQPVFEIAYTRSSPKFYRTSVTEQITTLSNTNFPTTTTTEPKFRVASTYYPNRMADVSLKFGNRRIPTTTEINSETKVKEDSIRSDGDDAEFRDVIDSGFTMEKLAYLLIGTCCGLSILCLCVVVVAIRCRRLLVEKRLKCQFRKRLYQKDIMPWQQQFFDHFMYLRRHPDGSCSSRDSCRCVTWSLGARNLDTRPICPTNRSSSSYLCGQKKLPFGAASSLRYESMLGRKRPSPKDAPSTPGSSQENDSLDQEDSDSRESDPRRHCTCIDLTAWPVHPDYMRRNPYAFHPHAGRYNISNCGQHHGVHLQAFPRDIPPPVTGSNYLDRSEGVVYWSSNDERLI